MFPQRGACVNVCLRRRDPGITQKAARFQRREVSLATDATRRMRLLELERLE
jgi:hypothetical protein